MDINIVGSVTQLGYGLVTTNLVNSLTKLGHKVALFHISKNKMEAHPMMHEVIRDSLNNAVKPNFSAPCIRIWHQFDMSLFCGGKKIGFPFFELDEFTELEKHHLSSLDEIIVASNWAKGVIEEHFPGKPTHVVPCGYDSSIFFHADTYKGNDRPFRFLMAGKWEYRKGHDVALEAFVSEFSEEDNVELVCLTQNPNLSAQDNDDWNVTFKQSRLGSKINIVPRLETQSQVADLMRDCDYGLFPTRAEGWNLEAIEMIACGRPIITTGYSAHVDFCTENNSHLIPLEEKEVAFDGHYFTNDIGKWMKFTESNIKTLRRLMRQAYNYRLNESYPYSQAISDSVKDFTWDNSAKKLVSVLEG